MGTPDFAVPSLEAVAKSHHDIAAVVTRPDAPRGRGRKLVPPEVKVVANELGIPVLQPDRLRSKAFVDTLTAIEADLFVVVAFAILPIVLLDLPRIGSINLHPSLLPRYRGAAPINWAIINGERETGITTFLLSSKVDAGDMLIQERVAIGLEETAGELYERLKVQGAATVLDTVNGLAEGRLEGQPQSDEGATPAPKLTKETGRIDWTRSADRIRNLVRGTNPIPGAFTMWNNTALKIHRVSAVSEGGPAGKVLSADARAGLIVGAGEGGVRLEELQPQGKKRMDGPSFVRGYRVDAGLSFC